MIEKIELSPKFQKITRVNNHLQIPDFPIIPYIEGDGIGADIWRAAKVVLNYAIEKVIWLTISSGVLRSIASPIVILRVGLVYSLTI